jgi:predicted glutamine amidotransferase
MARLFGFIGNRPDLGAKVLEAEAKCIDVRTAGNPFGWGVGFYQGGEVLLRRRPLDEREIIPIAAQLADVRSDALLGHARQATVGALRSENTHPFRYRQWLFAHTGTVAGFPMIRERLVESLPEFLRRSIRGESDSEVFFHVFLSFLHDAGQLNQPSVDPSDVRTALRASVALFDRLSAEEGFQPEEFNLGLTDGERLVAVHARGIMAYRQLLGKRDLEELLGDDGLRKVRIPDLATCRFTLLVADIDEKPVHFISVPPRTIVTLTRDADPELEAL